MHLSLPCLRTCVRNLDLISTPTRWPSPASKPTAVGACRCVDGRRVQALSPFHVGQSARIR